MGEEEGEWVRPYKDNPAYKGEWHVRLIPNPAYRGEWHVRMIPNPEYKDDDELYLYDDIGYIGIDVWQVEHGSIFDNIIITDDVAEANSFAKKWRAQNEYEKKKK